MGYSLLWRRVQQQDKHLDKLALRAGSIKKERTSSMSEFTLTQGAGQKLEFAVNRAGGTTTDLEWLSTGENFKSVSLLARGEAELVLKAKPITEPDINSIIRVNRSSPLSYPDWMKEVMHPELENTGPAEYDILAVEQWLHDGQKDGKWIKGDEIYAHLKKNNMLKTCLGLHDLEEIQKKGIAFFRKYFKNKAVFGWKGIVRHRSVNLSVPCLCEHGGKVVLDWYWTDNDWRVNHPALRLA